MEKHRMRYGNNKQRKEGGRRYIAFGNIIALTDDLVIVRAICASALPKKSRTFWEPYKIASTASGYLIYNARGTSGH